jgi:hypothetical protein
VCQWIASASGHQTCLSSLDLSKQCFPKGVILGDEYCVAR